MRKRTNILAVLGKIGDRLEKCINVFACIFLVIVAVAVIIQVLCRHINIPVVWLGELSVFAVIWTVFFGLALGYRHGMLAQVDIICHLLPRAFRRILGIFWDITSLALMLLVLVSSREYIAHVWARKILSPELRWPLYLMYLGPVLGYLFTAYFALLNILSKLTGWTGTKTETGVQVPSGPRREA
jgi:C4-dicarboxylate transporter DctQ subunit